LVEQLLSLEDDLKEIQRAMLFGVFGRAHALEPYLGRGITRENILDLVAFINGPCSCEIKAANPGMDLLTDWDWEGRLAGVSFEEDDLLAGTAPDTEEGTNGEAATAEPPPTRPTRVEGTPVGSAPLERDAAAPRAPTRAAARKGNQPQAPAAPAAPAPAAAASDREETPKATQDASPSAGDEARGPSLPAATPPADALETASPSTLNADLAIKLGFGLGGAAMMAAVAGFVLILKRRDQ
jgi:hypothetical protein